MTSSAIASIIIVCALDDVDVIKKRKRKQRIWMKDWLKKRATLSHDGLIQELQLSSPLDYKNYLRMDSKSFGELLQMVSPHIYKQDTQLRDAISPKQKLFATLRYLVSGLTYEALKFETVIAAQTLGKIIIETCEAIIKVLKKYIQIPQNEGEWMEVAKQFERKWNFPHCLGAIDGKHVLIRKPPQTGSYYFNYKHTFSIVLMAIVNANYEFLMIDVGTNGRVSDGGVFANTKFYKKLSQNLLFLPKADNLPLSDILAPYVFVADDAFPLMENIMKPFSSRNLSKEETIYNYRVSRARRMVENVFGIITSRFRIFLTEIGLAPEKVSIVVMACCYLHNFLRSKNVQSYLQGGMDIENVNTGKVVNADWKSDSSLLALQLPQGRNSTVAAKQVRLRFCTYFNNAGAVPWQENSVNTM